MVTKLKQMRQASGLSQSQLAERANLNVRTLQHYEQGTKNFDHARLDTMVRICLVLKCKIGDIIENPEYAELLDNYEKS